MNFSNYIELRRKALVLKDTGGYDLNKGESNPTFFEKFAEMVLSNTTIPSVAWEPFAGHTCLSKTQDIASVKGLNLISYDLTPCDTRVRALDSTKTDPGIKVGGVFFHPPYFGAKPFSSDKRDLSFKIQWREYISGLSKTANLIKNITVKDGLIFAIGRDYRYDGERIRLDLEYVKIFEKTGFKLCKVLISIPDIALVFKKTEENH